MQYDSISIRIRLAHGGGYHVSIPHVGDKYGASILDCIQELFNSRLFERELELVTQSRELETLRAELAQVKASQGVKV